VEAKTRTLLPYGVPPPTFRLPDAAHVGAVHLQVSDLQQSLDYYQHVLGHVRMTSRRVRLLSVPIRTSVIW
jgi:catechol-2,3-dioxygenase